MYTVYKPYRIAKENHFNLLFYNMCFPFFQRILNKNSSNKNIKNAFASGTNSLLRLWKFTGVASYGALGHVPPRLLTIINFAVNFRDAHSLATTLCGCVSEHIIYVVFCDSSCGSSVAAT